MLNNQGIAHVLDGNFRAALRCFTELDERIPNNIVFIYRRGLCHVVLGLPGEKRSLLSLKNYDRREVETGLASYAGRWRWGRRGRWETEVPGDPQN